MKVLKFNTGKAPIPFKSTDYLKGRRTYAYQKQAYIMDTDHFHAVNHAAGTGICSAGRQRNTAAVCGGYRAGGALEKYAAVQCGNETTDFHLFQQPAGAEHTASAVADTGSGKAELLPVANLFHTGQP